MDITLKIGTRSETVQVPEPKRPAGGSTAKPRRR